MAKVDDDELKKLPPAERIKKLKEIEKENQKEIDKAEKLIKKIEDELKTDGLARATVPLLEEVDITKLFGEEESLEGKVKGKGVESEGVDYRSMEGAGTGDYGARPEQAAGGAIQDNYELHDKQTAKTVADKSTASDMVESFYKKEGKG